MKFIFPIKGVEKEKIPVSEVRTEIIKIEEFDNYCTPDVEFGHLYCGPLLSRYQRQTKVNLIELGQHWRKRIEKEHPESNLKIIVHFEKANNLWFLDTFNYEIEIPGGIQL